MAHVMQQADWDRLLILIDSREVYRTGQNGTSVYASGTTLTLAAMPFTPLDAEFRAVLEYNAGGPGQDYITIYWASEHPMHIDAGVLTVQRANFQAGSTFRVFYTGLLTTPLATVGHDTLLSEETKAETVIQLDPWKLNVTAWVMNQFLSLLGQGGSYISPTDFTATWASATTLTLGSLPAGLSPTDVQFLGVIEWNAAGVADVYVPEVNHFEWTGPATLVVSGATFTNGSQFMVIIIDQQKGIGFHDVAPLTAYAMKMLGRVYATASLPTITDGRMGYPALTPLLSQRAYLRPPTGGTDQTVTCSGTVGVAVALLGINAVCRQIWFRVSPHWPSNDIIVVGFDGAANALINAAGIVQKGVALRRDDGWCPSPLPIDNMNTPFVAASAASVVVQSRSANDPL